MKHIAGAVAASGLFLALTSSVAVAQSRESFTVVNQTQYLITRIETASHDEKYWHDVQGFKGLEPGRSVTIDFKHEGPCLVDLRVYLNGEPWDWNPGFNFCENDRLTVSWNYTTGKAHIAAE